MEPVLMRLPRYAQGLKLIRIGVFIMLAHLVFSVIVTVKGLGASTTDEAADAYRWIEYLLWANICGTVAMLVGSVLAIPDFRRAGLPLSLVVLAAAGFAIATAALWWGEHVISAFVEVALDPESTVDEAIAAVEGLASLKTAAIAKDLAYVIGLIAVIRTVRQSAVANDQLALRDVASNLTGLLVIMLIGDLFFQLTYGLGAGGYLGLIGGLVIGGYWIFCHLRFARFLENAAYFVNEPHHVPTATVIRLTTVGETPRPSARAIPPARPATAPSRPSAPVIVVAPELRPAPAPRAASGDAEDAADPPRFLT